ncbi:hypothetical protein ACM55G_04365 [Flavobacterium sp. LB3P122]|uniref:hypothetical protein n=1 Tax=Flavobacterium algoriphilum TaxID=3398738 RepID=UPI003A84F92F
MSKKFYIMLLVMFGFCMIPSLSFACGTKSEKACCKKETFSKTGNADCCNKEHASKKKSHEGCNGACKNISCGSSTIHLGLTTLSYIDLNNKNFCFSSEKQNYYYSEIFISSDFRSVWLPPKIS